MGSYLNPTNEKFSQSIHSEIYVDKTDLIRYCNKVINTLQRYVCISRPRRFGKSMAADMLAAYYSRGCDSEAMFTPYEISHADSFRHHLNRYNVNESADISSRGHRRDHVK